MPQAKRCPECGAEFPFEAEYCNYCDLEGLEIFEQPLSPKKRRQVRNAGAWLTLGVSWLSVLLLYSFGARRLFGLALDVLTAAMIVATGMLARTLWRRPDP
jgi:hypothetical protein